MPIGRLRRRSQVRVSWRRACSSRRGAIPDRDRFVDQNRSDFNDALLYNRKTVFLSSAIGSDNPLPTEIRQNVASLGMYIMGQTIAVTSNPRSRSSACSSASTGNSRPGRQYYTAAAAENAGYWQGRPQGSFTCDSGGNHRPGLEKTSTRSRRAGTPSSRTCS